MLTRIPEAGPLDMAEVEVLAPNFKRRLSGVTSTIIQLVPVQARDLDVATLGPGLPKTLPHVRPAQLLGLWRRPKRRPFRIWHARRNVEMAAGFLLKRLLRAPVKLVFTSAAQRRHQPFTKWLIRRMDAVVATSARSGSFLEVPHAVIMHGVDTAFFHPPRDPSTRGASAAGLPGRFLVGCFGRVRHQKGTDLFVDAMIGLLPSFPDWTAVITGRVTPDNQAFARALEERIARAGLSNRIRLLGEVPEVASWYRKIHLYVAPSRNEGFGLTPLEAMASGAAVVASDAGAYAEMVAEGRTGAVVPAGDGAALTEAIRRYLADPELAHRHGAAGVAHVAEHFPLEKEAAGLRLVYEPALGGGAAGVTVCALVIHLKRAATRRPQVDKLLRTLPYAPIILDAVDAESLTEAGIASVHRPSLRRPYYPFALRRTEIACFLSHRAAWRRIVEEGHEAGLIVEDDVDFEPGRLQPMLDFARAGLQPGDYLRLPYRSRGERGRVLASRAGMTLVEPIVVGLGMQMQLVTRLAAERALAATETFDRPVDTTLQMRWLTGVRMLTLRPVVIREIGGALGGTTVQKKKKWLGEAVLREVRRASYRMSLRLASRAVRPTGQGAR